MAVRVLQAAMLILLASQARWTQTSSDQKAMQLHQGAPAVSRA